MEQLKPAKLKSLKESVRGHFGKIEEYSGYSYDTVQKVLSGKWYNETVILSAIKVRDQIKAEKARSIRKITSKL